MLELARRIAWSVRMLLSWLSSSINLKRTSVIVSTEVKNLPKSREVVSIMLLRIVNRGVKVKKNVIIKTARIKNSKGNIFARDCRRS